MSDVVRASVPASYAMWQALLYEHGDFAEDGFIATVREARGSDLPGLLAHVRDHALAVSCDTPYRARPSEDPPQTPVALLEWVLATYNAEALRSIAVLYFGHGVCCHTLAALWRQEPRTIIGRLERGYGLAQQLPRDGQPWRVSTDAELDTLTAALYRESIDLRHALRTENRLKLFAFAPRLFAVPPRVWARGDAVLAG